MENLTKIYKKLLKETDIRFQRYLYHEIDWDNRIVGIRGPRGTGKTTLMLQHIKKEMNVSDVLYVNADDIYFSNHRLIDLAEKLVQQGIHHFRHRHSPGAREQEHQDPHRRNRSGSHQD